MYTLQLDRCMCTILTRHASINQIKSHWKTSEGEKQAYICCMFVEGKSRTVFFPSDTLIYGICRDGTKNNNIRACEHLILGQFRMGARSAIYAPLARQMDFFFYWTPTLINEMPLKRMLMALGQESNLSRSSSTHLHSTLHSGLDLVG